MEGFSKLAALGGGINRAVTALGKKNRVNGIQAKEIVDTTAGTIETGQDVAERIGNDYKQNNDNNKQQNNFSR